MNELNWDEVTDVVAPVGGFSFDGVDIKDIGLHYAPENANTYVYRPSAYELHEEAFAAHDGGYFYGTTVKPKDFVLRCYYEAKHIKDGIMRNTFDLFKRGRKGKLVFRERSAK